MDKSSRTTTFLEGAVLMNIAKLQDLGTLIKSVRKQRRLTQDEVMFAADVSRTFLIDVESGKPSCEFDKVLRVANVVGISVEAQGPHLPDVEQ
jgi:transcriptional regulator with XRE-family HTH domain